MDKRKKIASNYKYMLSAIFTVCSFYYCNSQVNLNEEIIAHVNEDILYVQEFKKIMNSNEAILYQYFSNQKGVPSGKDFWKYPMANGKAPIDSLKAISLKLGIRNRVEWQYLKREGIVKTSDYYNSISEFKKENEDRKEKILKNQTVYGPEQLNFEVYLSNAKSKAILKLRELKLDQIFSDADVKKYYEEHKNKSFRIPKTVNIKWILVKNSQLDILNSFPDHNLSNSQFESIVKSFDLVVQSHLFIPENSKNDEIKYSDLFHLISDIQKEQITLQPLGNDFTRIIYVDKVIHNGYINLDDVRHVVKNRLFEIWYDNKVDQLIVDSKIIINDDFANLGL
jgi:hypothetical protein